jgi:hypothetical protein
MITFPGNCERGLPPSDHRDLAACYRRAGDGDTGRKSAARKPVKLRGTNTKITWREESIEQEGNESASKTPRSRGVRNRAPHVGGLLRSAALIHFAIEHGIVTI